MIKLEIVTLSAKVLTKFNVQAGSRVILNRHANDRHEALCARPLLYVITFYSFIPITRMRFTLPFRKLPFWLIQF